MSTTDTPNDYSVYQGEVDTAWLRKRIDHAMDNVSDLVISASQAAELCHAMEERDAMKARMESRWVEEGHEISLCDLKRRAASAPRGPYVAKVTNGGTDIEAKPTDTQIALVEHDDGDAEALAIAHYLKALDPGVVLSLIKRWGDAEYMQAECQALRDMLEDSRRTIALIAEVTGMPKEPHQGFQHRLVGHAKNLAEHAERLNAKLHDINDSLRGHGFEVANHHLNGDLEPMDTWFEDNDWEPEDVPASVPIFVCPTCCFVQASGKDQCRECKTPVPGSNGETRYNARQRAEALQWALEKDVSHQNMPFMIERLTAIADGKRQPCPCMGMMCRGCPDCMGVTGWA